MPEAVNIEMELAQVTHLHNRSPEMTDADTAGTFATLAKLGNGAVFVGSFDGDSEWERHTNGDELVHILDGTADVTVLPHEGGEKVLTLSKGMLTVVPQGCWHRFHAPDGVTVLTVTPQPTDHSTTDPREA
ncbi:MAG: cupin domain-containing protein [Alphaproteobacteria bacterium]|nr:MAG: cupin domain-containing protein [Alphaproteobacteria bacterium]